MEIARAKEILEFIREKEGGFTYPACGSGEDERRAYAALLGITLEELDEYIALYLAGDLDPILVRADVPVNEGWPDSSGDDLETFAFRFLGLLKRGS